MFNVSINADDVNRWVHERAQIIADNYESGDLYKAVQDDCKDFAHGWVGRALAIVAWAGCSFDALDGFVYETESPLNQFIDEVLERVKDILETDGYEFD